MFPFELFGWFTALISTAVLITSIAQWDPGYTYEPKRKRRPPDKFNVVRRIKAFAHLLSKVVQQAIERIPTSRTHRVYKVRLSSNGKHLFSLRLRRKGLKPRRRGDHEIKPPTQDQRANQLRYTALASFVSQDEHEEMVFDTDSFPVAIDNCASRCMTNDEADFIDTPVTVHRDVMGIGKVSAAKVGTIKWTIQDDEGRVHEFTLPDTLHSGSAHTSIVSATLGQRFFMQNSPEHFFAVLL
jgi:hypothetical protein